MNHFDEQAKHWDTEQRINRSKRISEEILNRIKPDSSWSALEFGCGTGLIGFNIFERLHKLMMVDSSKNMIEIVKTKMNAYGVDNIHALCVDLTKGNAFDEKFDLIYSSMVLHHIQNIPDILRIFHEVMEAEGVLCIVDLDEVDHKFHATEPGFMGHHGFNQGGLAELLTSAGFKNIVSNTFLWDVRNDQGEDIPYSLFLMIGEKPSS